jgi:protein SCO1/2
MKKIILFLSTLIAYNCSAPEKVYAVKGAVYEIKPDSMMIVIAHDTIPGLMYPMVMPFDLKDLKEIEGLSIGDSVHFEFVWGDTSTWARKFKVVGQGKLPEDEDDDFFEDENYSERGIGEIIDNVAFLDLDSSLVRLSDSDGKYRFLSFIFTRCPMPNMCPAVVIKNDYLAKAFKERNDIEFIMVSFDYKHDTPSVLKDFYGSTIEVFDNWKVWSSTGHIEDVYRLAKQSGCNFWGIEEKKIGHTLRSILIGPNREILGNWPGDNWKAGNVKTAIELLMK